MDAAAERAHDAAPGGEQITRLEPPRRVHQGADPPHSPSRKRPIASSAASRVEQPAPAEHPVAEEVDPARLHVGEAALAEGAHAPVREHARAVLLEGVHGDRHLLGLPGPSSPQNPRRDGLAAPSGIHSTGASPTRACIASTPPRAYAAHIART